LDIAVNNAGKCLNAPADEMTEEQWDAIIDLNMKGVFLTSQAAGRVIIKQRSGSIINNQGDFNGASKRNALGCLSPNGDPI